MMKTRLYRSDSFPYNKLHEDVELEKYIDTEGGTYLLTVLDEVGNFKLEITASKDGERETIYDSFNEFQDREALYKKLDEGVYVFMQETMLEFQTLNVKEKGKEIVIRMNNEMYVLTIVESTGICKMSYPARETEFYIDNIYIENPELPILKEGRLAQHLTEQVKKKLGLNLPEVPYLPGLNLTTKR